MGETTAVAHGGNPRRSALPPQDRAAFPRPRCIATVTSRPNSTGYSFPSQTLPL
ncbi:hypothetical protein [Moorena sp. SIO4G3]|uniref:hypothetical protein n=1 Tax=Moorena sp. SIO4G3 TaxID=2607821 RepID=UPI00142B15DD|nr:hypothetical protein [Moorena sp. SIO4G3]NEO80573.1 hypothetical protein [Moorena sp. SIO4G3]